MSVIKEINESEIVRSDGKGFKSNSERRNGCGFE